MTQSCHFKKWGRDISFTSHEAASEGNKNSLWVMKGTIIFLHERLSRNSEEEFPHERRSREWGNFFSLWLLSLEWRNIIVPWMTNREFFPSQFFKMTGLTFLFNYWKLFQLFFVFSNFSVVFHLLKRLRTHQFRFPTKLLVFVWRSWAAVTLPSWDFAAGINVYAKEF